MVQNVLQLFSFELFVVYLVISALTCMLILKLYFSSLKRINEGKNIKLLVGLGIAVYVASMVFMFATIYYYTFKVVVVTSLVMYIIMYIPMRKITTYIENKTMTIIKIKE